MSEVQSEVYYVFFTDKETGLVGAINCVDYETAVKSAEEKRQEARYSGVKIKANYNGHCSY
ncbi:hypothetical protein [Idiomarina sp.]|uniref:hypothetical protein n=1 Tax=Idiomarina sp. TaxID=1874361 RepID=UPI0025C6D655|nr:hypothetical protein [Idiomarina sp.]